MCTIMVQKGRVTSLNATYGSNLQPLFTLIKR